MGVQYVSVLRQLTLCKPYWLMCRLELPSKKACGPQPRPAKARKERFPPIFPRASQTAARKPGIVYFMQPIKMETNRLTISPTMNNPQSVQTPNITLISTKFTPGGNNNTRNALPLHT